MLKSLKILSIIILFCGLVACSATHHRESTGEYFDNAAITTKVKTKLFKEQRLSSLDIKVKSYKGVVQLSGFVDNMWQARQAEKLARSVLGVRQVVNNLIVK